MKEYNLQVCSQIYRFWIYRAVVKYSVFYEIKVRCSMTREYLHLKAISLTQDQFGVVCVFSK